MLSCYILNIAFFSQLSVGLVPVAPSASELLDAYSAGRDKVVCWTIKCQVSLDVIDTDPAQKSMKSGQICDCRSDGARASIRYHRRLEYSGGSTLERNSTYISMTWDGDKYISYRKAQPNGIGHVFIDDMRSRPPEQKAWEINSLLYGHPAAVLLGYYPGTFERVDAVLRKAKDISVKESTEHVGDGDCYVIDGQTEFGRYTIWIDPQHGFDIARAQIVRTRDEGHLDYGHPIEANLSSFLLENVHFEQVEGAWVAVEADYSSQDEEDRPKARTSSLRAHVKIDEITLNPDHDALRSFTGGDIPNGTDVLVMPALHIRYAWTDGDLVTQVNEKAVDKIDHIIAGLRPAGKTGRLEDEDANGLLTDDTTLSPPDSTESEISEANANAQADAGQKKDKEARPAGIILPRPYCGLYCVYAVLKRMDRDVNFRDLVKVEYVGSGEGSTMAELNKAARDNGLFAGVAAKLTAKGLRQCPYPVILHVKADWTHRDFDHYELVLGTEDDQAKLFDPPEPPRLVPFPELAARWDGYALAISDKPFDIDAIFGPDRQRLMLFVATGILVLLGVHLLRSRVPSPHWFVTRNGRLGLSAGQAGILALVALAGGAVYHVANPDGLVANAKATTLFQDAYRGTFIPRIGVRQVRRLLGTDAVIIDARYKEDYEASHLPGAISLPIDANEAVWRTTTDRIPKQSRILVYCQSAGCKFAERIGSQLAKDGFTDISVFRGGWSEWVAKNGDPAKKHIGKEDGADPNGPKHESADAGTGQ